MKFVYLRLKEQPYFGKNIQKFRGQNRNPGANESVTIAFFMQSSVRRPFFFDRRRFLIQKLLKNRASIFFRNML